LILINQPKIKYKTKKSQQNPNLNKFQKSHKIILHLDFDHFLFHKNNRLLRDKISISAALE